MKQLLGLVIIFAFALSAHAQEDSKEFEPTHKSAFLELDKTEHDYKTIRYKANGDCVFVVKNMGAQPLVLTNVQSSCGCAVPEWPHRPIPSGESREIKVTYDTKRIGNFSKSIKIFSNSPGSPHVVSIKGTVEK